MTRAEPAFVSLQQTMAQPVAWLWPDRIAAGRFTLIDGDPGQGKSLLATDIAGRLTSAREFPDGYRPAEPAAVLFFSGEDNLADTVLPRMQAAGADLDRVFRWNEAELGPAVFPQACPQLHEYVRATQVRLVVFDPFFAFLGQEISSLNDLMIRRALEPLYRVAQETQAAFLLTRHLSKLGGGKQAMYRGLGSVAILGTARTAFLLGPDPDDAKLRVFACTKTNVAILPASLGFRIVRTSAGSPRIDWLGPVPRTADDLVAGGRRRGEAVPQAVSFLLEQLASGPRNRHWLLKEAERVGISFRTLERAKPVLGISSKQRHEEGRNVWYWMLSE